MKQLRGWLTLSFAGLCALLIAVAFFLGVTGGPVLTRAVVAAALCWGIGFLWFIRFGRLARGRIRRIFGVAFYLLCADLLLCLGLCWFLLFFF